MPIIPKNHAVNKDACMQVARFMEAIFEPWDLVEVRMFPNKDEKRWPLQKWHRASDLPAQTEHLAEVNAIGHNIYFGANPRHTEGGRTEHVALARCLFVDFDNGITVPAARMWIADACLPVPTAIVFSGHGVQLWWRLDEPLVELSESTARQKGLIRLLNTDPVVHDPPRVMRLPGFRNHKKPAADAVLIEADPRRTYPLDEFPNGIHFRKERSTSQRSQQPLVNTPTSATSVRHTPEVRAAIALTLPDGPDQRRRKLFTLARLLKALPGFEGVRVQYSAQPQNRAVSRGWICGRWVVCGPNPGPS